MSNIVMYDTVYNDLFPPDATAYAGYVDGGVGDQPNYTWLTKTYPHADVLSIAIFPSNDADCLDIEPGAADPSDAASWYERQISRGVYRPCFYASASTMQANLIPVVRASGFPSDRIRLWSAHYGEGQHICGPATCKLTSIPMDGTQWTDNALGKNVDQSLLLPNFFAPQPTPDPRYGPPLGIRVFGGHTTMRLWWEPPAPVEGLPTASWYQVFIYEGDTPSAATLVKSYPRKVGNVLVYTGGSLTPGKSYTAHIVAGGPGGANIKPYTYASIGFTTTIKVGPGLPWKRP
jgi:hypothetical protein